jgi:hypothetical protein
MGDCLYNLFCLCFCGNIMTRLNGKLGLIGFVIGIIFVYLFMNCIASCENPIEARKFKDGICYFEGRGEEEVLDWYATGGQSDLLLCGKLLNGKKFCGATWCYER